MRCESPDEFPRELGLRYASHEGYEFQVSTAAGRDPVPQRRARPARAADPRSGDAVRIGRATPAVMLDGLGHCATGAAESSPARAGPLIVQVAVSLAPNDRALRELLTVLLLTGPLALAGTLGGGYLLARKALAPVDRMAATAQEITSTRLDRRLDARRTPRTSWAAWRTPSTT